MLMKSYSNDIVDVEQFKAENEKQTAEINKLKTISKVQSILIFSLSIAQIISAIGFYFH